MTTTTTRTEPTPAEIELARVRRTRKPTRVVVDAGDTVEYATSYDRAGVEPAVVFIRNDGWSLGAKADHAAAAEKLWRAEYVFRLELPSGHATRYRR